MRRFRGAGLGKEGRLGFDPEKDSSRRRTCPLLWITPARVQPFPQEGSEKPPCADLCPEPQDLACSWKKNRTSTSLGLRKPFGQRAVLVFRGGKGRGGTVSTNGCGTGLVCSAGTPTGWWGRTTHPSCRLGGQRLLVAAQVFWEIQRYEEERLVTRAPIGSSLSFSGAGAVSWGAGSGIDFLSRAGSRRKRPADSQRDSLKLKLEVRANPRTTS